MMKNTKSGCRFCKKFSGEHSHVIHPIFDKVIWENNNFVVIPARGSLVKGYLLIVPKTHYSCTAYLPPDLLSDLLKIKSVIRRILRKYFTDPVFFEHGAVRQTSPAGSSVDHAHMHCVAFEEDLEATLRLLHELRIIDKYEDISKQILMNKSYIFFENQSEEKYIIDDVSVPSQYLRRVIAKELGIPDQWDWVVFPFEQNVVSTLEILEIAQLDIMQMFKVIG